MYSNLGQIPSVCPDKNVVEHGSFNTRNVTAGLKMAYTPKHIRPGRHF